MCELELLPVYGQGSPQASSLTLRSEALWHFGLSSLLYVF